MNKKIMKQVFVLNFFTLLIACSGDSGGIVNDNVNSNKNGNESTPTNFSVKKYNEDLIGKFYLPEMKIVSSQLDSISNKANGSCLDNNNLLQLQEHWRSMTSSYQRLWALNHATLDRDPEVAAETSIQYILSSYPYNACRLQAKVAELSSFQGALKEDPAINTLELFLFSNITSKNLCPESSSNFKNVQSWLAQENDLKQADLCASIRKVSAVMAAQLNPIKEENKKLYLAGKSNLILSENSTQKSYDSISIFTDQILKDEKLGYPLGLSAECPRKNRTCFTAVEHQPSGYAFHALQNNLEGIMAIYNQNTTMSPTPVRKGLYQFLVINNKKEVADSVYQNIIEAHKLAKSLKGQSFKALAESLDNAEGKSKCRDTSVANPIVPVCALFKSVKNLSDLVKVDLRLALALSVSKEIEGDAD